MERRMGFGRAGRNRYSCRLRWWSGLLLILALVVKPALAEELEEVLRKAPDSQTAGLLNTEIVPEGDFQADFVTGHLWYGSSDHTNIFTNVYAGALALGGIPGVTLGGKIRYCETLLASCSLLAEVGVGAKLTAPKQKFYAGLLQHSLAFDFETSGRVILGLGAALFAVREFDLGLNGFENQFVSWLNAAYDIPLSSVWLLGAGYSPVIKAFHQYHRFDGFFVNRLGFAGGGLIHVRALASLGDWQLGGGGALLKAGDTWSLWPVLELNWRRPESLPNSESPVDGEEDDQ